MIFNRKISRRNFLHKSAIGLGLASLPLIPDLPCIRQLAFAQNSHFANKKKDNVSPLIVIFQRGGADGLGILSPLDDLEFLSARPPDMRFTKSESLKIADPVLLGNSSFYWHPSADSLAKLFFSKRLLVWQGVGILSETRSHFEAQEIIERGVNNLQNLPDQLGWITRQNLMKNHESNGVSKASIALFSGNDTLPRALLGSSDALAVRDLRNGVPVAGGASSISALNALFSEDRKCFVADQMLHTLRTINQINQSLPKLGNSPNQFAPYIPLGIPYPNSDPGIGLCSVARLLELNLGLKYAWIDQSGWDLHEGQVWRIGGLIKNLGDALLAFDQDMHSRSQAYTLVVITEFGRRLRTNRSFGTDHGRAGLAFVMGNDISGGQMRGSFPGLATDQLDRGVDLAVTTDYLRVLKYANSINARNN